MRTNQKSCHRVMAALNLSEVRQLHEIVDAIARHPESERPANPSEAIRWAISELHGALVGSGAIPAFVPGKAVIMETENGQASQLR